MSESLHTVHVRVNDAATGQPTPVRIRFASLDEKHYYAPFGRTPYGPLLGKPNDFSGGNVILDRQYAYIDGSCEIQLPSGPFTVEVAKGPEYKRLRRDITLGPGKIALRLEMDRWINLRDSGWHSGDIRAFGPPPHDALLEGAAEDLAVVNLLALEAPSRDFPRYPHLLAFSGQRPAVEVPGHMVVVNTFNSHPHLGSLCLLNCHRIVYPLRFGRPRLDNWTVADWCDQCHRKGGLVVWKHEFPWFERRPNLGEALADLILGKVDALELLWRGTDFDPELYFTLLQSGLTIPVVAGSGKLGIGVTLGSPRTYACVAPGTEFDYGSWIDAVRAGHTFVTFGPLVLLTVGGQDPGTMMDLTSAESKIHVRAEARSWESFDRLQILANGKVVASTAGSGKGTPAVLEAELALPAGGWVLARCIERRKAVKTEEEVVTALTSPVYVRVAGQHPPVDPEAVALFQRSLNETRRWVERRGRFQSDKQKQDLIQILDAARAKLDSN
jgi:hypothetical protein